MDSIRVNQPTTNRVSVKILLQRFMTLMAAVMVAMTFTACSETDDPDDGNDPDENGNGASNSEYRVTKITGSSTNSSFEEIYHWEYSYNNDGTLKRVDQYKTKTKEHWTWVEYTANADGTIAESRQYSEFTTGVIWTYNWNYNASKKPIKLNGISAAGTLVRDYFYNASGQLTGFEENMNAWPIVANIKMELNYNSQGRITTSSTFLSLTGRTLQYTWTYNSDGNPHTISGPSDIDGTTPVTFTYEYEKGKANLDPVDCYIIR